MYFYTSFSSPLTSTLIKKTGIMGCNTSRMDRLPAVALCRERCEFMEKALRQSYALADAHVAHMDSLKTLGSALLCFSNQFEVTPIINQIKTQLPKSPRSSDSDAHLVFNSESETEEEDTITDKEFQYDNVAYVYPPFPPSLPNNGGYYGSKPPSPPPPSSSAWDFLNLFEPYQKCEAPYSPIRNIDTDARKEEKGNIISQEPQKVKESKNLVSEKEPPESEECRSSSNSRKGLCEAVKEIQILFDRASDSGDPILEMLDVGKLRYHRKYAFNQVSCKVMHVLTPSIPLVFKCMGPRMGSEYEGVDKDKEGHDYGNLCSTLKKLCMWEKKLYHEVKEEEKLRMLHQKKCRLLTHMNKKGADTHKVQAVQTFIGLLATKMKISIQVVDKISITISKLTEEELWPQINRLIHLFLRMWKDMQECYRCQYQEIAEAKTLDASIFNRKLGNAHIDAAIKLKSEVQKWNLSFSDWIHAQKSYVKALNGWLVRCLLYEPEELPDNSTPFSPGKIGAPPVFVICNKWSQAMDNLIEKNVMEAINGFMQVVNELLEKHILDLQQKLTLDKELVRKVKMLDRREQKMHKVVKARERKMAPIAREESDALLLGDAVHHGDFVDINSIQSGLKQIFIAMERFTASTAHLYEELCQQIKQDPHVLGESNKIQ